MTSVMDLLLLFTAIFGVVMSTRFPHEEWGYGETKGDVLGPEDWHKRWPDCGHDRQSPININTSNVVSRSYSPLRMTFDNGRGVVTGELENNGHAPQLTINNEGGAELTGGPLGDNLYTLLQFHVHFGCANDRGSEHTLDGKQFSGQLHLVFKGPSTQLAVVALWIKAPSKGNPIFGNLANLMDHIIDVALVENYHEPLYVIGTGIGNTYQVSEKHGIRLMDLLPSNCGNIVGNNGSAIGNNKQGDSSVILDCYYTYEGSLTTPHCDETVHWIVLKEYLNASDGQLNKFRKLKAKHGRHPGRMCDNYRPIQPLHGRTVYSVTSRK